LASEPGKIQKYFDRAVELRAVAERMKNPESRKLLLQVASEYERLAKTLQKQSKPEA
jgi:hypothetical protein